MTRRNRGGLCSRQNSQMKLLVGDSVIVGQHTSFSVADEITTRIADMRDRGPIEADCADHDRRRHARSCWTCKRLGFTNARVGCLYEAGQQRSVRFHLTGSPKPATYLLHRCSRRNFSLLLSAHAICQCEQPSMRADLSRRSRQHVPEVVLVSGAHCAGI